jgi:hypothetical protein
MLPGSGGESRVGNVQCCGGVEKRVRVAMIVQFVAPRETGDDFFSAGAMIAPKLRSSIFSDLYCSQSNFLNCGPFA